MAQEKEKPAETIPVGRVVAAIWANKTSTGRVWYNVTITRSYRDGDQQKSTSSFGRDDLLDVAKAADMAFDWIWRQEVPANPDQEKSNG
jgi:hypothetical protein